MRGTTTARRTVKSLTSEALRAAATKKQRMESAASSYKSLQEKGESDGAEAARLRRQKMIEEAELNNPFMQRQRLSASAGGGGMMGLDAQFAQMERRGEFKNLPGAGKPFEHGHGSTGHASPFSGDALDEWISKYAAREGVKSASVELGEAYVGELRGFRQRLRQVAGGERALDRRVLEYEVQRLLVLRKEADDASLTDSLVYAHLGQGMRRVLPKVGTVDEELAKAQGARGEE